MCGRRAEGMKADEGITLNKFVLFSEEKNTYSVQE